MDDLHSRTIPFVKALDLRARSLYDHCLSTPLAIGTIGTSPSDEASVVSCEGYLGYFFIPFVASHTTSVWQRAWQSFAGLETFSILMRSEAGLSSMTWVEF